MNFYFINLFSVKCYFVELTNNAPVVVGATVSFKAELFDNYGQKTNTGSYFLFSWEDDAMPRHTGKVKFSYCTVCMK